MFGKASDFAGGSFFKPAEHMNDIALLIEPKSIEKNVASTYQNQTRHRDEVLCDITTFATVESVESKTPTTIQKDVKIAHGMLTSTLERNGMGNPFAGILRKVPTKGGSGYVFRDIENGEYIQALTDYYTEREAAVEAALADAPGFD